MHVELEKLKAEIDVLKNAVAEAVDEIKSLAVQLADHANDESVVNDMASEIHTLADELHKAVYPPSAAR